MPQTLDYDATLKAARKVGASKADEPRLLALYCDGPLKYVAGAVAPKLVWQGAMKAGLTARELNALAVTEPLKVADLMWA